MSLLAFILYKSVFFFSIASFYFHFQLLSFTSFFAPQVGTPSHINRHTAFVSGMFNSQLEAAKFEGEPLL